MITVINQPRAAIELYAPPQGLFFGKEREEKRAKFRRLTQGPGAVCLASEAAYITVDPDIALEAGPKLVAHATVRQILKLNPPLALRFLLLGYDQTQHILEQTVVQDPESLVGLLLAIDSGRITPSKEKTWYRDQILNNPFWAYNYLMRTPAGKSDEIVAFASVLHAKIEAEAKTNAECAVLYLKLHAEADPTLFKHAIIKDGMMAYLASHFFVLRGLDIICKEIESLTPQAATHIGIWGLVSGVAEDKRIEECITDDAGWTSEYLAQNEKRWDDWNWPSRLHERLTEKIPQTQFPAIGTLWGDLICAMMSRHVAKSSGAENQATFWEFLSEPEANADPL